MTSWLSDLGETILPSVCMVCGASTAGGDTGCLCPMCEARMPLTAHYTGGDTLGLTPRFPSDLPLAEAFAMYFYSPGSALSGIVYDFKYHGMATLARRMGRIMGRYMKRHGICRDADMVMPVPMHFLKRMRRGYNQAEWLARGLAEEMGLPLERHLTAHRGHRTQTAKSITERRSNVSGIFRLRHPEAVRGRHVLLVDDICTTGSTLAEAARTIADACRDGSPLAVPQVTVSVATLAAAT